MRRRTTGGIVILSAVLALTVAAPAWAQATPVVGSVRFVVLDVGQELRFVAAPGTANRLVVTELPQTQGGWIRFADAAGRLDAPAPCGQGPDGRSAFCPNPQPEVGQQLLVNLGDGNDAVTVGFTPRRGTTILGGAGADIVTRTGRGRGTVDAGPGDDHVTTGAGIDTVHGGDGNDLLVDQGSPFAPLAGQPRPGDELYGDGGHDVLRGGDEPSWLEGGPGNDRVTGGLGSDMVAGSDGDDILDGGRRDDGFRDTVDGGPGRDRISYASRIITDPRRDGVSIDLRAGVAYPDQDVLRAVEDAQGSAGWDILYGNEGPNRLIGGFGQDHALFGFGGNDELFAVDGETDFRLECGAGADTVHGDGLAGAAPVIDFPPSGCERVLGS